MFSPPEHSRNLSQRLSAVLDDIGVNEVMVMKRRRMWMLSEALWNIERNIENLIFSNIISEGILVFGSRTEGSTTKGLKSDIDHLIYEKKNRIIQDLSEWKQGKVNLLMVQDETTSSGYCLLQAVACDEPIPLLLRAVRSDDPRLVHFSLDTRARVLFRHSCYLLDEGNRHGPAYSIQLGDHQYDHDFVLAYHCSSWPKEANPWLLKQNVSGWPTEDMKRYSSEQGCFVVPVGSRTGMHQDTVENIYIVC